MKNIQDLLTYDEETFIENLPKPRYVVKGYLIWSELGTKVPFEEVFLEENITQEDWAWILFFSSTIHNLRRFTDIEEHPEFIFDSFGMCIKDNPYIKTDAIMTVAEDMGFVAYNGWDDPSDSIDISSITYIDELNNYSRVELPTLSEVFKSYKEFKDYYENVQD